MRAVKIIIIAMIMMSFTPVEATWTDIHQISSSSHTVSMTDGDYQGLQNAYDGLDYQSGGDPVIIRTYTCYPGLSTPSLGTEIVVDYNNRYQSIFENQSHN